MYTQLVLYLSSCANVVNEKCAKCTKIQCKIFRPIIEKHTAHTHTQSICVCVCAAYCARSVFIIYTAACARQPNSIIIMPNICFSANIYTVAYRKSNFMSCLYYVYNNTLMAISFGIFQFPNMHGYTVQYGRATQ